MGNAVAAAREPPAGGVLLPVERGTVGATTCAAALAAPFTQPFQRPAFDHQRPELPGLGEEAWEEFAREARCAAGGLWRSGIECIAWILLLPLLLLVRAYLPKHAVAAVAAPAPALVLILMNLLGRRTNRKRDEDLKAACDRLAEASGGRLSVEYRTMYTGLCRPRGMLPFRAVAIGPSGGGA